MRLFALFLCPLLCTLTGMHCTRAPAPPDTTSGDARSFTILLDDGPASHALLHSGAIRGSDCALSLAEVGGRPALRIATTAEFSDARLDLMKLFGHTIDFSAGGYLYFDAFIPEGSDVVSVKFNMGNDQNLGGCGNYLNKLEGRRGHWLSVEVPLAEQYPHCQNWVGEGNFLAEATLLTVNPYNADRADTALLYLNNIVLSPSRLAGDYLTDRLSPRPVVADNNPYTITFDRPELLARQQAYRTFEATTQTIRAGVAGNPTQAIRAYGTGKNRYICYLPDIEQMTGHPVNFYAVDSLFFDYYLTEASDSVHGARLFVTTGDDWEGILMVEDFMAAGDFRRGSWRRHAVALDDLTYTHARAPLDVLAAVYELRIDLKYDSTAGPIEIWYDNFGWQ